MLLNGLGELLAEEVPKAKRFVDLFTGSGSVASHVAQSNDLPVLAFDLQRYGMVLAAAVLRRKHRLVWAHTWAAWYKRAKQLAHQSDFRLRTHLTQDEVKRARLWCQNLADAPMTKAYGGHYFSPRQTVWLDAFLKTLPARDPARIVARAALVNAASTCAAAPGHTAQPFQPTRTAKKFLEEAWRRDIVRNTKKAFRTIAELKSKTRGKARVLDANIAAASLKAGDLVFVDPPYSGVHYSRFYHVLESIARGYCGEVTGVGRYPAGAERPRSRFSVGSEAQTAMNELLRLIANRRARAIVTFPDHKCSNGLSGKIVGELAEKHFTINHSRVKSRFSTMGGTGDASRDQTQASRTARQEAKELILVLTPKPRPRKKRKSAAVRARNISKRSK